MLDEIDQKNRRNSFAVRHNHRKRHEWTTCLDGPVDPLVYARNKGRWMSLGASTPPVVVFA